MSEILGLNVDLVSTETASPEILLRIGADGAADLVLAGEAEHAGRDLPDVPADGRLGRHRGEPGAPDRLRGLAGLQAVERRHDAMVSLDRASADGRIGSAMPEALARQLAPVFETFPQVLEAYVFGSVARGEARPTSDLDLAVTVDRGVPEPRPFGLRAVLITEIQAVLGRSDIDVVLFHQAPLLLQSEILRDGHRLFARDLVAATARESAALSRWLDWKPVQERIDQLLLAGAR